MPNESRYKRPWTCPSCSGQYTFPLWYQNLVFWGAFVLAFVLFRALGLTGISLYAATAIFWIPTLLICIFLLDRLWVPRLEPYRPKGPPPKQPTDSGSHSSLDLFHH
jgi:hypothetical protein